MYKLQTYVTQQLEPLIRRNRKWKSWENRSEFLIKIYRSGFINEKQLRFQLLKSMMKYAGLGVE